MVGGSLERVSPNLDVRSCNRVGTGRHGLSVPGSPEEHHLEHAAPVHLSTIRIGVPPAMQLLLQNAPCASPGLRTAGTFVTLASPHPLQQWHCPSKSHPEEEAAWTDRFRIIFANSVIWSARTAMCARPVRESTTTVRVSCTRNPGTLKTAQPACGRLGHLTLCLRSPSVWPSVRCHHHPRPMQLSGTRYDRLSHAFALATSSLQRLSPDPSLALDPQAADSR